MSLAASQYSEVAGSTDSGSLESVNLRLGKSSSESVICLLSQSSSEISWSPYQMNDPQGSSWMLGQEEERYRDTD